MITLVEFSKILYRYDRHSSKNRFMISFLKSLISKAEIDRNAKSTVDRLESWFKDDNNAFSNAMTYPNRNLPEDIVYVLTNWVNEETFISVFNSQYGSVLNELIAEYANIPALSKIQLTTDNLAQVLYTHLWQYFRIGKKKKQGGDRSNTIHSITDLDHLRMRMKDVFISHSTADFLIAEAVQDYFESMGLSCLLSCHVQTDTANSSSENHLEIDNCRVVVVLLSKEALVSRTVQQNLDASYERQRYGVKIIPLVVGGNTSQEEYMRQYGYAFAENTMYVWNDLKAREALAKKITSYLSSADFRDTSKLSSVLPEPVSAIGRSEELHELSNLLQENGKVVIRGLEGIGKTALVSAFCHSEYVSNYETIIYLPVDHCIMRTIASDELLCLQPAKNDDDRTEMSDFDYAHYKLKLLENSISSKTLLILDNLDIEFDPFLERVCQIGCDLILAVGNNVRIPSDIVTYELCELRDNDALSRLFSQYYGEDIIEGDIEVLIHLLSEVEKHTLTIVLLAKQMKYLGKKPSDYQNSLQLFAERSHNMKELLEDEPYTREIKTTYGHLFELFSQSIITKKERTVMKTMCLIPAEGITKHMYFQLMGHEYAQSIGALVTQGWIHESADKLRIRISPLVRDIIMHELTIHIDDPDISAFISAFTQCISHSWNATYQENKKLKDLALAIYYLFPQPSLSKYKEYLKLSEYLWIMNCTDVSIDIQNKIKKLFIDQDGKHQYSPEEAEVMLRIGFTYEGNGDQYNAERELLEAARIYGNKYASALSHLAQVQSWTGKGEFSNITALLQQSLSIRQTYWPGSVSEAASSHLYAKVLSQYGQQLDYAKQLEQRAYKIFNERQPGSANVSSAAYILGWLYVQTATDDDDLEYGIQLLEEARQLRLLLRGDILHPWMEDIYQKLGFAYEKNRMYEEAKECFLLLLNLRKNKYKHYTEKNMLIEVYTWLYPIYVQLNDVEGQKECKRYLRYHVE